MSDDVKAKIAAARARKAAAEASRAAAVETPEAELARVEREARDAEALHDAERTHGKAKIAALETDLGLVILKRAHPAHYKRFQDLEKVSTEDAEKLTRPCLVYPEPDAFDRMIEEQPGTVARCAVAIMRLAGARNADLSGKS
jgi:hypothetical protein